MWKEKQFSLNVANSNHILIHSELAFLLWRCRARALAGKMAGKMAPAPGTLPIVGNVRGDAGTTSKFACRHSAQTFLVLLEEISPAAK